MFDIFIYIDFEFSVYKIDKFATLFNFSLQCQIKKTFIISFAIPIIIIFIITILSKFSLYIWKTDSFNFLKRLILFDPII